MNEQKEIKIQTGNFPDYSGEHPENRNWVMGHFIPEGSMLHCEEVEVCWGRHPKGFKKEGSHPAFRSMTLAILVYGHFIISFPEVGREADLQKEGDYVIFDASETPHWDNVLEDSLLITVRWPSRRPE